MEKILILKIMAFYLKSNPIQSMKKIIIIIYIFLLSYLGITQKAKKLNTYATVRIEFVKSPIHSPDFFRFCKSEIKLHGHFIPFCLHSTTNRILRENYPSISSILGNKNNDYDCIWNDSISECDLERTQLYFRIESSWINSNQIYYYKTDTNKICITFRLKASVIEYQDINYFEQMDELFLSASNYYCDCWKYVGQYGAHFAVIEKVINEKPLSKFRINHLKLKKYSVERIQIFPNEY